MPRGSREETQILSVLGSVFLMVPGVCAHLSYDSLPRHTAGTINTLRNSIGQAGSELRGVSCLDHHRHLHSRPSAITLM